MLESTDGFLKRLDDLLSHVLMVYPALEKTIRSLDADVAEQRVLYSRRRQDWQLLSPIKTAFQQGQVKDPAF